MRPRKCMFLPVECNRHNLDHHHQCWDEKSEASIQPSSRGGRKLCPGPLSNVARNKLKHSPEYCTGEYYTQLRSSYNQAGTSCTSWKADCEDFFKFFILSSAFSLTKRICEDQVVSEPLEFENIVGMLKSFFLHHNNFWKISSPKI